jgi:predicted nucleic acid-binding protein
MKVLFDTSMLVASMVRSHPRRPQAVPWMRKMRRGVIEGLASTHTLAELYAVLTSLPLRPRITTGQAHSLIQRNVDSVMTCVSLGLSDYRQVLRSLADLGLPGGVVYDALTARAAHESGADVLLTLNPEHFLRVWPDGADRIRTPWGRARGD